MQAKLHWSGKEKPAQDRHNAACTILPGRVNPTDTGTGAGEQMSQTNQESL